MRTPSRVFVAWKALRAALDAVPWPAHPVQPSVVPSVFAGQGAPLDEHRELIVVEVNPEDHGINWQEMSPAGRRETFLLNVHVISEVPGVNTDGAVMDRLEALTDLVQGVLFDFDTDKPLMLPFAGNTPLSGTAAVLPQVGMSDEGWVGRCVVQVRCICDI